MSVDMQLEVLRQERDALRQTTEQMDAALRDSETENAKLRERVKALGVLLQAEYEARHLHYELEPGSPCHGHGDFTDCPSRMCQKHRAALSAGSLSLSAADAATGPTKCRACAAVHRLHHQPSEAAT